MNTRGDIKSRIKRELQMVSTSTLFSDASIEDAIWDATLWATDLYPFPTLEKASFTQTTLDYYYDYPSQFKSDSVTRLVVNSQPYDMIDFEDWLDYKKNNPNQTDEFLGATYGRQYFLFPTPTTADLEIIVWGLIQPPVYTNDNNKTVFSDSESALNEGIMRKALSALLGSKGKASASSIEEKRAEKVIVQGWNNIVGRRSRFKRKDRPFFDVPNLFPDGTNSADIGNFTRRS